MELSAAVMDLEVYELEVADVFWLVVPVKVYSIAGVNLQPSTATLVDVYEVRKVEKAGGFELHEIALVAPAKATSNESRVMVRFRLGRASRLLK